MYDNVMTCIPAMRNSGYGVGRKFHDHAPSIIGGPKSISL